MAKSPFFFDSSITEKKYEDFRLPRFSSKIDSLKILEQRQRIRNQIASEIEKGYLVEMMDIGGWVYPIEEYDSEIGATVKKIINILHYSVILVMYDSFQKRWRVFKVFVHVRQRKLPFRFSSNNELIGFSQWGTNNQANCQFWPTLVNQEGRCPQKLVKGRFDTKESRTIYDLHPLKNQTSNAYAVLMNTSTDTWMQDARFDRCRAILFDGFVLYDPFYEMYPSWVDIAIWGRIGWTDNEAINEFNNNWRKSIPSELDDASLYVDGQGYRHLGVGTIVAHIIMDGSSHEMHLKNQIRNYTQYRLSQVGVDVNLENYELFIHNIYTYDEIVGILYEERLQNENCKLMLEDFIVPAKGDQKENIDDEDFYSNSESSWPELFGVKTVYFNNIGWYLPNELSPDFRLTKTLWERYPQYFDRWMVCSITNASPEQQVSGVVPYGSDVFTLPYKLGRVLYFCKDLKAFGRSKSTDYQFASMDEYRQVIKDVNGLEFIGWQLIWWTGEPIGFMRLWNRQLQENLYIVDKYKLSKDWWISLVQEIFGG